MLGRFRRIYSEFGTSALIRTVILIIGIIGMVLMDFLAFSSIRAALIAMIGLPLGALFRAKIVEGFEYLNRLRAVIFFVYPVVLFLGKRFSLDNSVLLAIITVVTVFVFNLQFWSLSDLSIINTERQTQQ
jgi:hypothetical protein